MGNWTAHTKHNFHFNCNNTTQDKTKVHKVPIDEGKDAQACRHERTY